MADESGCVCAAVIRVAPNRVHNAVLGINRTFPTADRLFGLSEKQFDDGLKFFGWKETGRTPVQLTEGDIDGSGDAETRSEDRRRIRRLAFRAAHDSIDLTSEYCGEALCSCISNRR